MIAYQCHSLRQMNRVRKLLKKLEGDDSAWKNHRKVADLKDLVCNTCLCIEH